jgi:hemoglobin
MTMNRWFAALALAGATLAYAIPAPAADKGSVPEPPPSLYERLGGVYPIATVVDDFIETLLVSDILNANPAIKEARQRVPKAGLKFHVTELVCQATGGPQTYTGRDMKSSHAHLSITEREWQAMAADFKKVLDRHGVPAAEQGELLAIVESVKPQIVMVQNQANTKR